jgi:hypothetical protein
MDKGNNCLGQSRSHDTDAYKRIAGIDFETESKYVCYDFFRVNQIQNNQIEKYNG